MSIYQTVRQGLKRVGLIKLANSLKRRIWTPPADAIGADDGAWLTEDGQFIQKEDAQ